MIDALSAMQNLMNSMQLQLQTINQNIANLNTPGFKRQIMENNNFENFIGADFVSASQQMESLILQTQGSLRYTANPNHIALSENAFFQVQKDEGVFYTKRGDFQRNAQGELITADGAKVLGFNGSIKVEDTFTIDQSGTIWINKNKVDKLALVSFDEPQKLEYLGEGLFSTEEAPKPIKAQVLQGHLEESTVKSVEEMSEMMQIARKFESAQRVMRTADSMVSQAISQLGESNV